MDNATGAVSSQYKLQAGFIYATQPTTEIRQGPPGEPPAAPVPLLLRPRLKAKEKGNRTKCSNNLRLGSNGDDAAGPCSGPAAFLAGRDADYFPAWSDLSSDGLAGQGVPGFADACPSSGSPA